MQVNHRDEWLSCLRAAFEGLDADNDGRIHVAEIMKSLAAKLPEAEVCVRQTAGTAAPACSQGQPCQQTQPLDLVQRMGRNVLHLETQ